MASLANPGTRVDYSQETSAGSWDESHEEFKRAETDEFEYLTTYAKEDIIPKSETVTVSTIRAPAGTALLLSSLSCVEPHTEGFVITTVSNPLETEPPLLTGSIPSPTSLFQPVKTTTDNPEETGLVKMATSNDIFANPIDTSVPLAMFQRQRDHPCPRKGITKTGPLSTNKFYSNFFLGDQKGPVYTFPYSLAWSAGGGPAASWGMAISLIDASQRVFGPVQSNGAAEYYINPVGIQSMIISAKELGTNTVLTMDSLSPHYARAMLRKDSSSAPAITFPIAQGSVFTTAYFSGATPFIQSGVYFKSMTRVAKDPKTNVRKFNFVLEDGTTWRLYAYKTKGDPLDLKVANNGLASSSKPFYGLIQIAKDPKSSKSEAVLDNGCGIYPTGMTISGSAVGAKGTYTFTWSKSGHATGTSGCMAVGGTTWTMVEPSMPVNMRFAPWHTSLGSRGLSTSAQNIIKSIAQLEFSQDMMGQSDLESMYFAGKALAKFGSIVYVINTLLGDKALGQAGLAQLKKAFAKFGSNKQKYPLVYKTTWGGVVSSASYVTGDANVDFGNTYYNDHHFHYGYHILTAAFIGSMNSTWLAANKAYAGWRSIQFHQFRLRVALR
ncbi:glycosyl hydrolase family 81-domain-containing protein [Ilyonectria robusta]|uniref:glycosyl hydrolase family 81-domain-containing protein n=1 Tax=Ilyonectria robusta TaxID=1079257 RepID=UPI001E8E8D97|nr:glycosyl hydrolase family 81-domain-containing protein [Ilyonectria robusta]KAH8661142.1 glycosyl hydrolase family 81-domain-containing protein [Ilyonectria robusta]